MIITLQERLNWVAYLLNISNKDISIKEGDTYSKIIEYLIIARMDKLQRSGILFSTNKENTVLAGVRVKRNNYNTNSNGYIIHTFNNILENCEDKLSKQANYLKSKKIELVTEELDQSAIRNTLNKGRRELLIFCCAYNNVLSTFKKDEKIFKISGTEQDSWLIQQLIQTIIEELTTEFEFTTGKHLLKHTNKDSSERLISQALEADTIIQFNREETKDIIIDTKLYTSIADDKGKYISNANRYQMNSYIGAYGDKFKKEASGIILHIVDDSTYNKYNYLNGTNQSVEEKREIKLCLIKKDENVEIMKDECRKIMTQYYK